MRTRAVFQLKNFSRCDRCQSDKTVLFNIVDIIENKWYMKSVGIDQSPQQDNNAGDDKNLPLGGMAFPYVHLWLP